MKEIKEAGIVWEKWFWLCDRRNSMSLVGRSHGGV